ERIKKISATVFNYESDSDMYIMGDINSDVPKGYGYDIMSMQDIDRRRIAMGIHDTVIQNLTALMLKNDFVIKLLNSDVQRAKLELEGVNKILKGSINELRDIIYDLRPMSLEDLGFEDAFNNLINKLSSKTDMKIVTKYEADINEVDSVILSNLLRVIRELCTNSIKHSKGTIITASVKADKNNINIIVEDNGVGFDFDDSDTVNKTTHFGLSMITDRVKYLNGTITAKKLQRGIRFKIVVPKSIKEETETYGQDSNS
ncbi:MAG: sensor histidine kinase, partial [Lachnospira sp.]|nr:sensor histidine kinase [Lachnospira sp.]